MACCPQPSSGASGSRVFEGVVQAGLASEAFRAIRRPLSDDPHRRPGLSSPAACATSSPGSRPQPHRLRRPPGPGRERGASIFPVSRSGMGSSRPGRRPRAVCRSSGPGGRARLLGFEPGHAISSSRQAMILGSGALLLKCRASSLQELTVRPSRKVRIGQRGLSQQVCDLGDWPRAGSCHISSTSSLVLSPRACT